MMIIDRLLDGMSEEYSNEDVEARAEIIYQYIERQVQQGLH